MGISLYISIKFNICYILLVSKHFFVLLFPLVFSQYSCACSGICVYALVQNSVHCIQILPNLLII